MTEDLADVAEEHLEAAVAHPGVTDERLREVEAIATWAGATGKAEAPALGGGGERPAPRSVADGAVVELREVTAETVRAICRLQVAPSQRHFVAPVAVFDRA